MSLFSRQKGKPELIVKLYATDADKFNLSDQSLRTHGLSQTLARWQAQIVPIAPPQAVQADPFTIGSADANRQELGRFFHVVSATDDLDTLRAQLASEPAVEAAYVKPPAEPAALGEPTHVTVGSVAFESTPNFTPRQQYLDPAPVGVNARFAWSRPGGKGEGITIIDCEWNWNFHHEDLQHQCKGVVVGEIDPTDTDTRHGTCVLGVIIGNENGFGITGIAPKATAACAVFGDSIPRATSAIVRQAADLLSAGDIILLEVHRPGPHTPNPKQGQKGYIPIEWWPDDFLAISYATAKGIIVIEAAGNGYEDLDHPDYDRPQADFPANWKNPLRDPTAMSGAVLVGAGMPPAGTHERARDAEWRTGDNYVDRARCVYSNFGSRLDCQGWGFEVTTLSYRGDLYDGGGSQPDNNRLYTDLFAGTSSASPIVTGVVACIQGALRAAGRPVLTPAQIRELLRQTGSPQQEAPSRPTTERIGSRPDLQEIFSILFLGA